MKDRLAVEPQHVHDQDRDLDLDAMLVDGPVPALESALACEEPAATAQQPLSGGLHYWDQLSPPWSSGAGSDPSPSEEGQSSFIRIRGVTRRIERFTTVEVDGAAQFDVTVLVDDGHNEMRCAVSNHLVERFLDLGAADYLMMLEQLGSDKAARREAKSSLVQRFMHLHGLFWAYPRRKHEIAAAAELRASTTGAGSKKTKKAKGPSVPSAGEEGERVVLIDFADEDVAGLCRALLQHREAAAGGLA